MKISRVSPDTGPKADKPNILKSFAPAISGGLAYVLTYNLAEIPFAIYQDKTDAFLRLNKNESQIVNNASKKAFEVSGLKKAGKIYFGSRFRKFGLF